MSKTEDEGVAKETKMDIKGAHENISSYDSLPALFEMRRNSCRAAG